MYYIRGDWNTSELTYEKHVGDEGGIVHVFYRKGKYLSAEDNGNFDYLKKTAEKLL